jgi:hypothetical protein
MKMHESSMDEIHENIEYYRKIMDILTIMLKGCRPVLSKEELCQEIIWNPEFENMQFALRGYAYEGRYSIYESEIKEYILNLNVMLKDYDKFLTEIMVKAAIDFTLYMVKF